MKQGYTAISIVIGILGAIFCALMYFVGYDAGYSKALDERLEASECKPSWRWRQRW